MDVLHVVFYGLCTLALACLIVFIVMVAVQKSRANRKVEIVRRAATKLAPKYTVNTYRVNDLGAYVDHVAVIEFDSIFKVAQFVPLMYTQWITNWFIFEYGARYREWTRKYQGYDGQRYALLVRTHDGYWHPEAERYLQHL